MYASQAETAKTAVRQSIWMLQSANKLHGSLERPRVKHFQTTGTLTKLLVPILTLTTCQKYDSYLAFTGMPVWKTLPIVSPPPAPPPDNLFQNKATLQADFASHNGNHEKT